MLFGIGFQLMHVLSIMNNMTGLLLEKVYVLPNAITLTIQRRRNNEADREHSSSSLVSRVMLWFVNESAKPNVRRPGKEDGIVSHIVRSTWYRLKLYALEICIRRPLPFYRITGACVKLCYKRGYDIVRYRRICAR